MKGGKVIHFFRDEEEPSRAASAPPMPKSLGSGEEIVENWGDVIRKARQKKKLTIEELASRIMEKGNFMHAIENGRVRPTIEVAKKLEKELGIKLIEKLEAKGSSSMSTGKQFKEPTLEDMLEKE
jgi:putative transcription factor